MIKFIVTVILALFMIGGEICVADDSEISVALCYAYNPPVSALSQFDWAVVDSDADFNPNASSDSDTVWLSYVSVGEVSPQRSYYKLMPKSWFIGDNIEWEAKIINQTATGWPEFFIDTITAPLWKRGFKGFFLDTLDSYQRASLTDAQRKQQESGLVHVIQTLKAQFPSAIIILNRGFEILPNVHKSVNMVAFESLFSGWSQAQKKFVPVSQNDRDWLLERVREIRSYSLPVLSIDYYDSKNTTWARNVAEQIEELDIVPYVTDPQLQTVGIGPPNMDE